jgi:hypothetical protein
MVFLIRKWFLNILMTKKPSTASLYSLKVSKSTGRILLFRRAVLLGLLDLELCLSLDCIQLRTGQCYGNACDLETHWK